MQAVDESLGASATSMSRRSYSAMEALGARCDICPLRDAPGRPVPIELHKGAGCTVVATAPKSDEVDEGRPLCGPGGQELGRALRAAGATRMHVNIVNAVACRFPLDDAKGMLAQIRKENKANKATPGDEDYIVSPFECCAPRLRGETEGHKNFIALGGYALKSLIPTRKDAKILGVRGHQITTPHGRKVFPTLSPTFVMAQKRWTKTFYRDILGAFRWFSGRDAWKPPHFVNAHYDADDEALRDEMGHMRFWAPTPGEVRDYLKGRTWWGKKPRWLVYDLETDGIQTDILNIRCCGIGGPDHVMVIPFLSVDGITRFYSEEDEEEILAILKECLEDPEILKVGHNAGSFDRECCEYQWGILPTPLLDTVLVHKGVDAELAHNLNYVTTMYTVSPAWKDDKDSSWDTKFDPALFEYCGLDVCLNARVTLPVVSDAKERGQYTARIPTVAQLPENISRDAVTRDHAMQAIGVGMHKVGMPVRQGERAKKEKEALANIAKWRDRTRSLLTACDVVSSALADAGVDRISEVDTLDESAVEDFEGYEDASAAAGLDANEFNPNSHVQVRKLMVDVWDLPEPVGLGKTDMRTGTRGDGDLRTGRAVLQAYMVDKRLAPQQRALMHSIFMFRRWSKLFGSYVRPMRYAPGETKPRCYLRLDGRIHSQWNAHGTLVGRYSCSRPNSQTLTGWVKSIVGVHDDLHHPDGMCIVGADIAGIHLKIIAELWNIPSLLETFESGLDSHSVFAELVMGDQFRNAPGYNGYGKKPDPKSLADKFRDMAKTLKYAGAYGAKPETIFRVMRSAVDDDGRLQMPFLKLEQVVVMHDNWMIAEPEWERAWNRNIAQWKLKGYLESPILGRRRYFLDQNENDMRNYEILSGEGDIMGEITQEFVNAVPFEYAGPNTGLINQCHDALYAQVPRRDAERVANIMREVMTMTPRNWKKVGITPGSVDIGQHMGEVAL